MELLDSGHDSKATRRARLSQYRKHRGRWQFFAVGRLRDGKPDPEHVIVGGEPVNWQSPGAKFYLDWIDAETGKRIREIAGVTPRDAKDAWRRKSDVLGGFAEPEPYETEPGNRTVDDAIAKFLLEVQATKGVATYASYARDLRWFRGHCRKQHVSRLNRDDVMTMFSAGREEGLNQKTINKRVIVMLAAMRGAGARIELRKGDWPKTVEKKIEIYEHEELEKFFAACKDKERLVFQLFLHTGFRAGEVMTLTWPDINNKQGTISMSPKSDLGFTPKSYEVRSVPVPRSLLDTLAARKNKSTSLLVLPTPMHPTRPNYGGNDPDNHMLELCKEIALRAGLNCGRCIGTYTVKIGKTTKEKRAYRCKTDPRCRNWYLHKWRHTFATNMLQSGVDIRSLQLLLGHKNIATTEKYVKALRLADLRDKIENSQLAAFV